MIADDPTPRSRRSMLRAASATLAAAIAALLGRPLPVAGADGDPMLVGQANSATSPTRLRTTDAALAFRAVATGSGTGLDGSSTTGIGVRGTSEHWGVFGESIPGVGVFGSSDGGDGMRGSSFGGRGVSGTSVLGTAVHGVILESGAAVHGETSTSDGVALRGIAPSDGYGLDVTGRVRFQSAGLARIMRGSRRVVVTPGVTLSTGTKVLCTLHGRPGEGVTIHRVSRSPATNTFTVHLTADAAGDCPVSWLLID